MMIKFFTYLETKCLPDAGNAITYQKCEHDVDWSRVVDEPNYYRTKRKSNPKSIKSFLFQESKDWECSQENIHSLLMI